MLTIRNIDHVPFINESALRKTVYKFVKNLSLKQDIEIVFDKKIKRSDGIHEYKRETQKHTLRIGITPDQDGEEEETLKYKIMSTILHELKHSQQMEKYGEKYFYSREFTNIKTIDNDEWSLYYAERECEARMYENKNLKKAIDFYESLL